MSIKEKILNRIAPIYKVRNPILCRHVGKRLFIFHIIWYGNGKIKQRCFGL